MDPLLTGSPTSSGPAPGSQVGPATSTRRPCSRRDCAPDGDSGLNAELRARPGGRRLRHWTRRWPSGSPPAEVTAEQQVAPQWTRSSRLNAATRAAPNFAKSARTCSRSWRSPPRGTRRPVAARPAGGSCRYPSRRRPKPTHCWGPPPHGRWP